MWSTASQRHNYVKFEQTGVWAPLGRERAGTLARSTPGHETGAECAALK